MKTVYRKPNPHLFDVAIDEIQTALDNECSWLNTIFGRCERLVKEINGNKYYTANWYKTKNDYIQIAPDEGLGNFCFFVLDEPTDLENHFAGDVTRSTIGFSLIVWCDLRTIGEGRDTEAVKEELLQILNGRTHLRSGRMTIDKVYERAENVFREFDYDEIDNQFMMHPFAGFRIEGELIVDTLCDAYIPPIPPEPPTPYIEGHVTDGATTFEFRINNNTIKTVEVKPNGWWKWEVDTIVTSLASFTRAQNIDIVNIYGIDTITSLAHMFSTYNLQWPNASSIKELRFINCNLSNVKTIVYAFVNCRLFDTFEYDETLHPTENWYEFLQNTQITTIKPSFFQKNGNCNNTSLNAFIRKLDLRQCNNFQRNYNLAPYAVEIHYPKITSGFLDYQNAYSNYLINLTIESNEANLQFINCPNLSKQSVLNIINAAAANVTYTLHSTVYAKCATGGEWGADVQAAIDAKAAQGYTVTLISA